MTTYYVGPEGNDGNSGLTWALRKLTLNGAEDVPVVAGDVVYVGPGVYREQLTIDVSGGNVYNVGTVTVTKGSTTVTGAGTAFLANVAIADMFHNRYFASGNDGVANGTATFTSAGGNFQAGMIGKVIQINARNTYVIGAVAAANSITLLDPNGVGWPGAGAGLTYSVMSGEGPYEIDSITDNTNFELVRPWCGPTLTGLAYLTYRPIRYIADVTGENTDGVGGVVRATGSNNDQAAARTQVIFSIARRYRLFRGFWFNLAVSQNVWLGSSSYYWTFEDCGITEAVGTGGIRTNFTVADFALTVRRCFFAVNGQHIWLAPTAVRDDSGTVIENSIFILPVNGAMLLSRVGGITIKNCWIQSRSQGIGYSIAPTNGQGTSVNNSIFTGGGNSAMVATRPGDITENFNSFFGNLSDRLNTAVGASSTTYPAQIQPPLLKDGYKFPWWFPELSEWSAVRAIAGAFEPCGDLRGIVRPVTAAKKSWGPVQFADVERDVGTTRGGSVASLRLADAGRHQIMVPTANQSTTVSVYVYREVNYAGNLPQLVIKQPGQADRVTTDVGAAGAWNLLTDTFTPAADPPYVFVELVSRNTAAAGNYDTFFEDVRTVPPVDIGNFDTWLTDRIFWPNLAGSGIASPIFGLHILR